MKAFSRAIELKAGPWALSFLNGELRDIRLSETVAVQRISTAVRDRNWATIPNTFNDLRLNVRRDRFTITFEAESHSSEVDFGWSARIEGSSDGVISYSFTGQARRQFQKNRIGFCLLHPAACAGAACRYQTPNGQEGSGAFPLAVDPRQPFLGLSSFSHQISTHAWAHLDFEGEVFEMEDQRNWSDGSFKIYCTPLALPFPVMIHPGERVEQRITLHLEGEAPLARRRRPLHASAVKLEIGPPTGTRLCEIGFGLGEQLHQRDWYEEILEGTEPSHIRIECDLDLDPWEASLPRLLAVAKGLRVPIWCLLTASAVEVPEAFSRAFERAGVQPQVVLATSNSPPWSTAPDLARSIREAFALYGMHPLIGGGTNAHFAELNRSRPAAKDLDIVFFGLTPQVHSVDDRSLVENLDGIAPTVRTAAAFARGAAIAVSPVTLTPRFSPNLTDLGAYPGAMRNAHRTGDLRQRRPFCAAWTLASIGKLSAAGASSVTYFEISGPDGIGEVCANGHPQAWPVREVFGMFAGWSGAEVRTVAGGNPHLYSYALVKEGRSAVFCANLSDSVRTFSLNGIRLRLGPWATFQD